MAAVAAEFGRRLVAAAAGCVAAAAGCVAAHDLSLFAFCRPPQVRKVESGHYHFMSQTRLLMCSNKDGEERVRVGPSTGLVCKKVPTGKDADLISNSVWFELPTIILPSPSKYPRYLD